LSIEEDVIDAVKKEDFQSDLPSGMFWVITVDGGESVTLNLP